MKRLPKSLEVLPMLPFEVITGALKDCCFRVTKTGSNIVYKKIALQNNKGGRDSIVVKSASHKWRYLTDQQKEYWQAIAGKYLFYTRWTAFCSSFFLSVDEFGLEHTMDHDLSYIYSKNRRKRYEQFENSRKRRLQYKVNPEDYAVTEETLKQYPIEFTSVIYVKLEDRADINLALEFGLLERSDSIVEYDYYPDAGGDGSSGRYIRTERPRIGAELSEAL